jgi:hypothetical protein
MQRTSKSDAIKISGSDGGAGRILGMSSGQLQSQGQGEEQPFRSAIAH